MASFIPVDVACLAVVPACEFWTRPPKNALAATVVGGGDSLPKPGSPLQSGSTKGKGNSAARETAEGGRPLRRYRDGTLRWARPGP